MTLTRVFQQKNLFFGGVIILLVTLVAVFAPMLTSYDPINDADLMMMEMPPSSEHLFGTDSHGRDAFSRVLYGARVSLSVGLITQVINTIIGVTLGLIAGYFGRFWDDLIRGVTNIMLSNPGFVVALAVMSAVVAGVCNMYRGLCITNWSYLCRWTQARDL